MAEASSVDAGHSGLSRFERQTTADENLEKTNHTIVGAIVSTQEEGRITRVSVRAGNICHEALVSTSVATKLGYSVGMELDVRLNKEGTRIIAFSRLNPAT